MRRVAIRAALVLAIAAAVLMGGAGKAFAASCSDAQVVPRIAELSVTQGAPGYARLARGKETIVRAYLTTPTACPLSTKQSISPISATLDVSYSNGASGTQQQQQLTNYQPLSGRLGATQQIYSSADPFFVVPDSYLAPANDGAA